MSATISVNNNAHQVLLSCAALQFFYMLSLSSAVPNHVDDASDDDPIHKCGFFHLNKEDCPDSDVDILVNASSVAMTRGRRIRSVLVQPCNCGGSNATGTLLHWLVSLQHCVVSLGCSMSMNIVILTSCIHTFVTQASMRTISSIVLIKHKLQAHHQRSQART